MDFRPEHRELSDAEKTRLNVLKDAASALGDIFDAAPPSREMSLAKTKLEEAVMWAVKGLTA